MLISEFSEVSGLSRDTIRFYVRLGLFRPVRGAKGGRNAYQEFTQVDVRTAQVGRAAQSLGVCLAHLATLQKKPPEKRDYVGSPFPQEARATHRGEAEARAIHGQASRADAQSLIEDGIPVSPLLFPVAEPGEEN